MKQTTEKNNNTLSPNKPTGNNLSVQDISKGASPVRPSPDGNKWEYAGSGKTDRSDEDPFKMRVGGRPKINPDESGE